MRNRRRLRPGLKIAAQMVAGCVNLRVVRHGTGSELQRLKSMKRVQGHWEVSADEASQGGHKGQLLAVIALFGAGLLLFAAAAFILISLSAQA